MSISKAIQTRDFKLLTETVNTAVETYKAAMPDEATAMVETAFGQVPASMLFDEDSKWQTVTAEYVKIANAVKKLPKGCDENIETAKIIATSGILRHITSTSTSAAGSLL